MSMKKVVFSSLILLTIITLYITKNNTNKIFQTSHCPKYDFSNLFLVL